MDVPKLNLKDFLPSWQREFSYPVGDLEIDRPLGPDVNVPEAPGGKVLFSQASPTTQDVVKALLIRQGGF